MAYVLLAAEKFKKNLRKTMTLTVCCEDDPDDEDVDLTHDHLTRRMKYLNVLLNHTSGSGGSWSIC